MDRLVLYNFPFYENWWENMIISRRGVVGRVPAFNPGGPGLIPGGVGYFNFYPETGYVSFVFCPVLSTAVALILC